MLPHVSPNRFCPTKGDIMPAFLFLVLATLSIKSAAEPADLPADEVSFVDDRSPNSERMARSLDDDHWFPRDPRPPCPRPGDDPVFPKPRAEPGRGLPGSQFQFEN